jgi:hypothetical protein
MRISEMVRSVLESDEPETEKKSGLLKRAGDAIGGGFTKGTKAIGGGFTKGTKATGEVIKSGAKKTGAVIKSGSKLAKDHPWKTAAGLGVAGSALGAATNHPYATYGSAGVSGAIGVAAAIKKLNDMRKARAAKKAESGNV